MRSSRNLGDRDAAGELQETAELSLGGVHITPIIRSEIQAGPL